MKIGELARRTGVSVRSLRYYEEQGLIDSTRTSGGQRIYEDDAVQRVDLAQMGFSAGMSLRDVLLMLPCIYSGTTTPAMVEHIAAERLRLDDKIAELTTARARLDDLLLEATARLSVSS